MSKGNTETPTPSDDSEGNSGEEGATSSLDSTAATLVSSMPEVQEHAIAATQAKEESRAQLAPNGEAYDPARHLLRDGKPYVNSRGGWTAKRGNKGRINGAATPTPNKSYVGKPNGAGTSLATTVPPVDLKAKYRAGGKAATQILFALSTAVGGEEWKPRVVPEYGINEPEQMEDAFANYFEYKNWQDLPPGWALCVVLVSYSLPRFTAPKTKARMSAAKLWVATKLSNWRNRRQSDKHE